MATYGGRIENGSPPPPSPEVPLNAGTSIAWECDEESIGLTDAVEYAPPLSAVDVELPALLDRRSAWSWVPPAGVLNDG